jgi:hypothetical protein
VRVEEDGNSPPSRLWFSPSRPNDNKKPATFSIESAARKQNGGRDLPRHAWDSFSGEAEGDVCCRSAKLRRWVLSTSRKRFFFAAFASFRFFSLLFASSVQSRMDAQHKTLHGLTFTETSYGQQEAKEFTTF